MSLTTARIIDVCDAVVSAINGIQSTSGLTYTASRVYSFYYTDSQLSTLRVNVRPQDILEPTNDEEDRTQVKKIYTVEVAVQKMVNRLNPTEVDAYQNLVAAIDGLFRIHSTMTAGSGGDAAPVSLRDKRFAPLFRTQPGPSSKQIGWFDSDTPNCRFYSVLELNYWEWVAR